MINTDYVIDALDILLCEDCLINRYHPLINYKKELICALKEFGCERKSDAQKLSDDSLLTVLPDADTVALFRRFLTIYDTKEQKFKELSSITSDPERRRAFCELYLLPGVKAVRAELYYLSGYKALADFAYSCAEDIIKKTSETIAREKLSFTSPLAKEARTHIAVSKAFCLIM